MPIACPYCGAEETADGRPFKEVGQIYAHVSSKVDDDHKDIGIGHVKARLRAEGVLDDVDDQDADDVGGADRNPALDGPSTSARSSTDDGCPSCGGELETDVAGNFYQEQSADDGVYLEADDDDVLCLECGVLYEGGSQPRELVEQ